MRKVEFLQGPALKRSRGRCAYVKRNTDLHQAKTVSFIFMSYEPTSYCPILRQLTADRLIAIRLGRSQNSDGSSA